jgi:hypothetical protein
MLLLRGLVQPLIERRVERDTKPLEESLRLADPSSSEVIDQDPVLGVSARARVSSPLS